MHDEKLLKQSRLQVETDVNALVQVLQWFEQFAAPLLPEKLLWACKVALDEGFTNAVIHAHRHLPQTTPIELELKVFPDCLEMRIWDQGEFFDLQAELETRLQLNNPLDEHGRGLIWMHELTDELSYQRQPDERNCLFMRKWR